MSNEETRHLRLIATLKNVALAALIAVSLLALLVLSDIGHDIATTWIAERGEFSESTVTSDSEDTSETTQSTGGATESGTPDGEAGSEPGESAYVWITVSIALIVSVLPLLFIANGLWTGSDKASSESPITYIVNTSSGVAPPAAGSGPDPPSGASTSQQASFTSREPAIATAAATAIVQLLIIFGFGIAEPEQASIIAGLTALAGLVIRGQVTPKKSV